MRKIILICTLFYSITLCAQVQWQKLSATKAPDFGLSYSLPKTVLYFDTEYTKTTLKAAPYFRFAEKLLGITDIIAQDSVYYSLGQVSVWSTSEVDKNSACMVLFKSPLPYIVLNDEGILCAVNTNADTTFKEKIKPLPNNYVMVDAVVNSQLALTEETLASGSVTKMANLVAKQIFRLRESRLDLLTGDAEQRPKDGEGIRILLEQIDKQEKALTSLFIGSTKKEKFYIRTKFVPTDTDLVHSVLFRFSQHFGCVEASNLCGEPIYIDIKATDRKEFVPVVVDPKKKVEEMRGLAYNIPGKGSVILTYGANQLLEKEFTLTQFGIQANFPADLFTQKKGPAKVVLNPATGAIVSLLQ
jgi:hypothetical protein